jgi:acyl-homoserine lactone acylase PvdQ
MTRLRSLLGVVAALLCAASVLAAPAVAKKQDTARYILPPGNYGGLPFTENSTDQLPLYSGLTPYRDDITRARINQHFLPEDFKPIGETFEEETGRAGTEIIYDEWGIPHITGETREDLAFGAGWVTARDRGLLLQLGRGPARAAVADIPNLDAFSLVTSAQTFEPSAATEALVTEQQDLIVEEFGKKGREIIRDAQAYADGINAYWAANNVNEEPATVNDVFATTAFIGSIFGAGGGGEAANSNLLAQLQDQLGARKGHEAWEDVMLLDDPEAPTTIDQEFEYGPLTGGKVKGAVTIDAGSIQSTDPTRSAEEAAAAPARKQASNWLLASPNRSATGNPLAVMGPQLGYYYPEIVQQMDLKGPGIKSQGAHVPGLAMYTLIGRTQDYAWSLTSAGHDVRDVYAEKLCEPDGDTPTRDSTHYVYKGKCRPFQVFDAGLLNGDPVVFNRSVHGSVFATATVDGKPYAMARKRSTYGRDALNLVALHDMTEGKAKTAGRFWETANNFGFTFNWAYASRKQTAFFSSGRLPERSPGLDRRLPTLGTGKYEWEGFLDLEEHPHAVGGRNGLLLNWNNRAAPGFMHGDDEPYGSVQRVELFDGWPKKARITDNVGIMNRAATEDVRSPVWPVISEVLNSNGPAPSARDAQVVALLDDWVDRDAPRMDADADGTFDEAAPEILDRLWRPIADTVMEARLGPEGAENVDDVRGLGGPSGHSYVDKDLRRLLGESVRGRFNLSYCGRGKLAACRASLWAAVHSTADALEASFGSADPTTWLGPADTTGFAPGLLSTRFPSTNRPTFQQVIELQRP